MNNKGFTLVELLATVSLLAILMMIAVPNVIGVVNRNKNKTYIEDAKKMISLAEYKIRSNSSNKPTSSSYYCFTLNSLGMEELEKAPNGGVYDGTKSYVKVNFVNNKLNYYVQLVEVKNGSDYNGIAETASSNLFGDNPSTYVSLSGAQSACSGTQK